MQIAIVTQVVKREDGQGRVNFELARDLLLNGHCLTLIASEVDASLLESGPVRWVQIPQAKLPTFLLRDQAFALRTSMALRRLRDGIDLIIVNGFVTWSRSHINLVHFVHAAWLKSPSHPARTGLGVEQAYRWLYSAFGTWLESVGFRRCNVVVAVSNLVRQQLIDAGVAAEKIEVVANGVDITVFKPGSSDRSAFGLPKESFIALFAGDLRSSRKNLETVLKAMAKVPDIVLAVAGGLDRSPYPAMARSLGISNRVHFVGLTSEISKLMCCVDAFVFPSRFEPFGLVVLEASACGLPVITSSMVGACDALQQSGMILVESPDDVDGIANALTILAADPVLRDSMGHAAHHAAQQLSWINVMKSYRQIVGTVVLQRQAAS